MGPQRQTLAELLHQRIEDLHGSLGQHEILERQPRLLKRYQGKIVAGLGKRPQRRHLQRSARAPRLIEDRFELLRDEVVALAPLVVDEILGGALEPGLVAPLMKTLASSR